MAASEVSDNFCNDSAASTELPMQSFEEQFKDLTSLITYFEECSLETRQFIENMREKLGCEGLKTDLMTETERERLKSYSAKKSTLLVVGQTNSGKSSFVNELLVDKSRPTEGSKIAFNKKKLPKEEIELDDSQRRDPSWVNAVVEVGLNNSLLQNGHLEVIDAPGMSENEALDKIVEECIHGILQVIIYVIDGNSSLRLQERGFLLKLKEKVGNLPIFYLCNKVDNDQRAREFDRDSDSEEDEKQEPNDELGKEQLAYKALAECHMVPEDIESTQCPFFHGLSSKEVRKARLKNESNQYTKQFDVLKSKLLKFATVGVTNHLRSAAEHLCQIQERVFDFFLSCDFNEDTIPAQNELFDKLDVKEHEYVNKMRSYVSGNVPKFSSIIENAIRNKKISIEVKASQMQFDAIKIGDVVGRNEVVEQCRRQIKDMVLFEAMNISLEKIQSAISVVTKGLRSSLEMELNEVGKKDDRLANLVKKQLKYSFLQQFQTRDICPHFDYALMKIGVKLMENAKKAVSDVWSAIRGKGTLLNGDWKRNIAEDVLDSIDCYAIANRICASILADLENGHQLFKLNLAHMREFCRAAVKQSDAQRRFAAEQSPYFARLMSNARALYQTLTLDVPLRASVGKQVGRQGHRGQVFEDGADKSQVVKKLTGTKGMPDEHLLSITRTIRRIQNDILTVLRPVSLVLDGSNRVTVLFPRMTRDLFDHLQSCSKPIDMWQGLRIVQQMNDALEKCWRGGIYHIDLRITNILLDHNQKAKLNVSKPRDDSIPYPDNFAPFHVPAKNPGACKLDPVIVSTLKNHCVYSLGVLLFLLVRGKFCRPAYAHTENVEEVFSAVSHGKDCEYLYNLTWKDQEGQYTDRQKDALKIVLSTFRAHQQKDPPLLTWMDDFTLKVTTALSCYEWYDTSL